MLEKRKKPTAPKKPPTKFHSIATKFFALQQKTRQILKAVPNVTWTQYNVCESLLTGMMNLKASRSLQSPLGYWIFKY